MPTLVHDHHLKNFDEWIKLFKANRPAAPIGRWRVLRGVDDPNRVFVVVDAEAAEVAKVNDYFRTDRMKEVIRQVNEMSTVPLATAWFENLPAQ